MHPGKHRLLHIHRNVPGVLSEINKVFAGNNINIASQYLQTNEAIGYVVIDIDVTQVVRAIALEKAGEASPKNAPRKGYMSHPRAKK